MANDTLTQLLVQDQRQLLDDWVQLQANAPGQRRDLLDSGSLRAQSSTFLDAFADGLRRGAGTDLAAPGWERLRGAIEELSRQRVHKGFTSTETATFVFSLKQPLLERLRAAAGSDATRFADESWQLNTLLDAVGLYSTEVYQKGREEVIMRQQQELLELSTPVVLLWDGILALPLIGTLDSARTQVVMESLLEQIVEQKATIAIIDITGVPTVDTLVAQHLLKTVAAARLMGADCTISGIRPQIAQTIVHLWVELGDVATKATLAAAFAAALKRLGLAIVSETSRARS